MRLGDLDALREDFARYTWGPYNPFARIDAAPTVSCAECEHRDAEGDDTWVCSCHDSPTEGMEILDPTVEACLYFQRRQP
jgi:hypothetical protein